MRRQVMVQAGDGFWHRCATHDLRHTHDTGRQRRCLEGLFRLRIGAPSRPHPPNAMHTGAGTQKRSDQRFRWSWPVLWAWLDLNQRPHPERKIPGSCGEGFEGDVVAEAWSWATGPPDSHPSWRPPAMAVLSANGSPAKPPYSASN